MSGRSADGLRRSLQLKHVATLTGDREILEVINQRRIGQINIENEPRAI
ncbi:MAG: hypothetical protein HY074_03100 [Deltaproteobacteria bacterium]|nr:hypothetical protein [Deltaproteobacteria bacterium]